MKKILLFLIAGAIIIGCKKDSEKETFKSVVLIASKFKADTFTTSTTPYYHMVNLKAIQLLNTL